ncbi:MAG: GNAT family N-acetyltransferase [Firmicutes bacterium]|nr:GNAT family N-acetyltransferase [Bacillota bacterium]
MEIRKATLNDLEAIAAVEAECFPPAEAASLESIRKRLTVFPDYFWVLFDGDKMVGFVNGMATDLPDLCDEMYDDASMHKADGKWQMIFGVDTIPEYRKQGCAERVLKQVISDTKAAGKLGLVLTCKDHLVHYYAKFGFVDEGISDSTHGGVVWHKMRLTF